MRPFLIIAIISSLSLAATSLALADGPSPITITNSGSTNMSGYKIDVLPNGSATYEDGFNGIKQKEIPLELTNKLYISVQAAAPLASLGAKHCAKSVSFGTTTTVIYNGSSSPDLSCAGDPKTAAIYENIQEIQNVLGVIPVPRHRLRIQQIQQ